MKIKIGNKMKFYSTNNPTKKLNFSETVLKGLADDGGLFMPEYIPQFDKNYFENIDKLSIQEIAFDVLSKFIDDISTENLKNIIVKAFTFDAPLVQVSDDYAILELFHGPTFAFKDFGARFLANTVSVINQKSEKETVVIVATSGDTGSAVASAFLGLPNTKVYLFYPSGKVSKIQEMQMTTFGQNVQALETLGVFDDCQKIVKQLIGDDDIQLKFYLTSANSINTARLLPQVVYYFRAYAQIKDKSKKVNISVPSGNLGNITAGLIAKKMGLPIDGFVSSLNSNSVFSEFLTTGEFKPRDSVMTLSNAMDVGNPSNFHRIWELYEKELGNLQNDVISMSYTDEETIDALAEFKTKYNYLLDPHGAVGYLGAKNNPNKKDDSINIILETAHPGKFSDVIEKHTDIKVVLPENLEKCQHLEKQSIVISPNFDEIKLLILNKK